MPDAEEPRRNPTIPELPENPPSLGDALQPLFEPPIPDAAEFLTDGWWKAKPDEADGQIMMLWLRYRQTAVALAVACKTLVKLEERVKWLEANQKTTVQ